MVRRGNTKEIILDTAEELLQERGFNGFSYQHIARQVGIKSAAVHYHFAAKSDLGVALARRYRERFADWSRQFQAGQTGTAQRGSAEPGPIEKVKAYFGISVAYLKHGSKICPLGALAAEFMTLPADVRDETQALYADMRDWLTQALAEGREQGVLSFNGEPANKALVISSALQGALQLGRAAGAKIVLNTIRQLKLELGIDLPSDPQTASRRIQQPASNLKRAG